MKKAKIIKPGETPGEVERFLGEAAITIPIDSVQEHPQNPRKRKSLARIIESIRVNGFYGYILVQKATNFIIKGNHSWKSCKVVGYTKIKAVFVDIDDEAAKRILLADNASTDDATYDNEALYGVMAELAESSKMLLGTGWRLEELDYLAEMTGAKQTKERGKPKGDDGEDEAEDEDAQADAANKRAMGKGDVPDALWPTDNEYEIPLLDRKKQATALDLPVFCWGTQRGRRGQKTAGTYAHYTTDSHLEGVWRNPHKLLNTPAINAFEVNFSVTDQTPFPMAVYHVYRKRWLSRFWQSKDVKIFVDLYVPPKWDALNLNGVPKGWRAYCSRIDKEMIDTGRLMEIRELAEKHAGTDDIVFVCYGGSENSKRFCGEHGILWIPDDMAVARGKHDDITQPQTAEAEESEPPKQMTKRGGKK